MLEDDPHIIIKLYNLEVNTMKNVVTKKLLKQRLTTAFISVLSTVLFISANTNSSLMIHQPKVPTGLRRFSKIK